MFMGSKNSGPAGYSEVRNTPAAQSTHTHTHTHSFTSLFFSSWQPQPVPQARSDAVPSGDVPISILTHKIFKTPNEWEKREYEQKLLQELQV